MLHYILNLHRILFSRRKTIDKVTLQKQIAILTEQHSLNEEEIELLRALLEGKSNKEIALEQKLTLTTINHRFYSFHRKLGIKNRAELVARLR